MVAKPSPRGGCYRHHSSVPAPALGHSWHLLGTGAEWPQRAGRDLSQPPALGLAAAWCNTEVRLLPAESRAAPSLVADSCVSASLHDGGQPHGQVEFQGPSCVSRGARISTGQLAGVRGSVSIPVLASPSRTRSPCKPAALSRVPGAPTRPCAPSATSPLSFALYNIFFSDLRKPPVCVCGGRGLSHPQPPPLLRLHIN